MTDWQPLLPGLVDGPRENGTRDLAEAANLIAGALSYSGLGVERFGYIGYPHEVRLLGGTVLLTAIAYPILLRRRRFAAALGCLLLPLVLATAIVDYNVPVFGGLGSSIQQNIVATRTVAHPVSRLVLSAHYDTKTEIFDHIARAPIQRSGLPISAFLAVVALLGWFRRSRDPRRRAKGLYVVAALLAPAYGIAFALAYSGGALVRSRSHGALDDGAACAVLLSVAPDLARADLRHAEVQLAFFSGEEIIAQGSRAYAASRFARGMDMPTVVINLDAMGASRRLVVGREAGLLRSFEPHPDALALVDAAYRALTGGSVGLSRVKGLTDALSFLERGVPAATVVSMEGAFGLPRGMHTREDNRERIAPEALDFSRQFALRLIEAAETEAARRAPHRAQTSR